MMRRRTKARSTRRTTKATTRRTMRRRTTMRRTTTRATTRTTMRTTTTRRRRRTNDGVRSIYADLRVVWRRFSHRLAIRQWRLLEADPWKHVGEVLPHFAALGMFTDRDRE